MALFSNGNIKVKANIFNLPCQKTCKPGLSCYKYCYAKKAERLYPSVLPSRLRNEELSKTDDFIHTVVNFLSKKKNKTVRIHESGDFYSRDYILKWYVIIEALPDFTFYAYTKRVDLFTRALLEMKPKNLVLIKSIDGIQTSSDKIDVPNGYNKVAVTHESMNNCPAIDQKEIKCGIQCRKCMTDKKEVIIFKKH